MPQTNGRVLGYEKVHELGIIGYEDARGNKGTRLVAKVWDGRRQQFTWLNLTTVGPGDHVRAREAYPWIRRELDRIVPTASEDTLDAMESNGDDDEDNE